jgi:hypothetical protein
VTLPAGQTTRRSAFAVIIALLASAAMVAPFASMPVPEITALVPISQSVVFTNDLITSMLLMSQYVIVGWRAILFLAVGYLCTALLAIIHLLTYPGAFTPTGLLGAGSTARLWEFWHAGFPIAVILYIVLKDDGPAETRPRHLVRADSPVLHRWIITFAFRNRDSAAFDMTPFQFLVTAKIDRPQLAMPSDTCDGP